MTTRRASEAKRGRLRQRRFTIGFAPLLEFTYPDAFSVHLREPRLNHESNSGDETRQDYKDTKGFPLMAPSCALLFLSCDDRVVVEALPTSPRPVSV